MLCCLPTAPSLLPEPAIFLASTPPESALHPCACLSVLTIRQCYGPRLPGHCDIRECHLLSADVLLPRLHAFLLPLHQGTQHPAFLHHQRSLQVMGGIPARGPSCYDASNSRVVELLTLHYHLRLHLRRPARCSVRYYELRTNALHGVPSHLQCPRHSRWKCHRHERPPSGQALCSRRTPPRPLNHLCHCLHHCLSPRSHPHRLHQERGSPLNPPLCILLRTARDCPGCPPKRVERYPPRNG